MMRKAIFFLILGLFFIGHTQLNAQGSEIYNGGINIPVGQDSSKNIRIILLNQFWAKWVENNPGTVGANGELAEHSFDIGVRRARATIYSQITPRFLIFTQIGINNQTFINGGAPGQGPKKPQLFFHDAWTEYSVVSQVNPSSGEKNPFSLALGMGLHFWNGVSRFSNASVVSFMTLDLPVFNFPNIEQSDQFGRQFGIYAKGKAGPLDYRFHLNKPFVSGSLENVNTESAVDIPSDKPALGGYVAYEFLEPEGNLTPFRTETYVGTKRVFNLGAGFYHQPEASGFLDVSGDLERQDHTSWAVDAFLDYPFGIRGMAITAYSVLYNYDYGTDYYRSVGVMNTAAGQASSPTGFEGDVSIDGFGNAEPLLGTGSIFLTQAGLLLPDNWLGSLGKLQPFARVELKNLDYLDDSILNTDLGLNWFIEGHHAKITLQYGTRELFIRQAGENISNDRLGQWTLQTQIYI